MSPDPYSFCQQERKDVPILPVGDSTRPDTWLDALALGGSVQVNCPLGAGPGAAGIGSRPLPGSWLPVPFLSPHSRLLGPCLLIIVSTSSAQSLKIGTQALFILRLYCYKKQQHQETTEVPDPTLLRKPLGYSFHFLCGASFCFWLLPPFPIKGIVCF